MTIGLKTKGRQRIVTFIAAILFAANAHPQPPGIPDWQKAAGGKLSFDVASVRPAAPGTAIQRNVDLGGGDAWQQTGGLFRGSLPVWMCIAFAYKLFMTRQQRDAMFANLPEWTRTENFVIEARGPDNATKDQMRLMMQSLLAERFGLKVHFEDHETLALDMTLAQPGKLGPKIHPHSEGPPCDKAAPVPSAGDAPGIWPPTCDAYALRFDGQHPATVGSRNTTLDLLALNLSEWTENELGRRLVNHTGLTGRYDFTLTSALNPSGAPLPPDSPALQGLTLIEAMREQLGIKLTAAKLPVPTLVIDHLERPSVN